MSIRKHVTLVAIFVTLLVAAALILVAHIGNRRLEARIAHEVISSRSLVWNQVAEHLFQRMEAGIPAIQDDFALRQALKTHDTAALQQAFDSLTQLIGDQGYFDHLRLLDATGALAYGEDGASMPVQALALARTSIADDQPHRGIGRDAAGMPVALVAFRLSVRHVPVGTAVFQTSLAGILPEFETLTDAEVYLLATSGQVLAGTRPDAFEHLGLAPSPFGERAYSTWRTPEATFRVTHLPILGLDEQPVAQLISLTDDTAAFAAQQGFEWVAYGAVALMLLLATLGLHWYVRHALRPLDRAVETVARLADGDLNVSFETGRKDEVGQLMSALHGMAGRIRDIVSHLHAASGDLHHSAGDMERLARTSKIKFDRQQAETGHVDRAVSQLASSALEVVGHTSRAVETTFETRRRIENSREILDQTARTIERLASEIHEAANVVLGLADHSQAVGNVLNVIRAIANQTNLLALNASIEAARAGEQGRGFAVVADEVRQLALRTQGSIQEIEALIGSLQSSSKHAVGVIHANRDRARESVDHYGQAVRNLDAFTESVNLLTDMTHQIASAAEEQSRMAEEIADATNQISQAAREHAQAAESGFGQSVRLNDLSNALRERVAYFRIH